MRISDWSSDVCSSDLCIVYNDDVFAPFTAKPNAAANQLWVEHGEPLLFDGGTRGLTMDVAHLTLKVVDVVDGDWKAAGVIVHDQTNRGLAHIIVEMPEAGFPVALGVPFDNPAQIANASCRERVCQ